MNQAHLAYASLVVGNEYQTKAKEKAKKALYNAFNLIIEVNNPAESDIEKKEALDNAYALAKVAYTAADSDIEREEAYQLLSKIFPKIVVRQLIPKNGKSYVDLANTQLEKALKFATLNHFLKQIHDILKLAIFNYRNALKFYSENSRNHKIIKAQIYKTKRLMIPDNALRMIEYLDKH
jgi:hypothetical protein